MGSLQLHDVTLSFGPRDLLQGVTFSIAGRDRVALTGANGSGKSTLMRIMADRQAPDAGSVVPGGDTSVGYLPQGGVEHSGRDLWNEVERVYDPVRDLIAEMEEVGRALEALSPGARETEVLVHKHAELEEDIRERGYYDRDRMMHRVLTGLGFTEGDFSRSTLEFSAGWRMRIALAKVLLAAPDILLLDEPTNYLDMEARDWLEEYIGAYLGAVMVVSHDRYFLDRTVDKVAEIYLGKLGVYRGNFSQYEIQRRAELESIIASFEQQQAEIARLEDFIRRFRYNASKAAQVQSRIKQLDKIERIEIPEALGRVRLTFPQAPHSGRQVMTLRGVSRRYGETDALVDVNLELERGQKLVLVGSNGAGKSTLMRIIAGRDREFEGERTVGTDVQIGFFSQDDADAPDPGISVFESVEAAAEGRGEGEVRNLLGAFLFQGDDAFKPVSVLSGGERSRLELLKLLLSPKNFLVLDEPTNHLDMTSKRVLLDALVDYTGTVVFVSHDRYFIDELAERVFELRKPGVVGQRARLFPGDYEYYRLRVEQESIQIDGTSPESLVPRGASGKQRAGESAVVETTSAPGRELHEESKKIRNEARRLRRREEDLLSEIDDLEERRSRLERRLADPDVYTDGEKVKALQVEIDSVRTGIEERQLEWESVSEELESIDDAGN